MRVATRGRCSGEGCGYPALHSITTTRTCRRVCSIRFRKEPSQTFPKARIYGAEIEASAQFGTLSLNGGVFLHAVPDQPAPGADRFQESICRAPGCDRTATQLRSKMDYNRGDRPTAWPISAGRTYRNRALFVYEQSIRFTVSSRANRCSG